MTLFETNDCRAYIVKAKSAHQRLHQAVRKIQYEFAGSGPGPADSRRPEVVTRLRRLREELALHFEEEDTVGCLEEAVVRLPRLSEAARQIAIEHPLLLRQLDGILEQAQVCPWSDLNRRVQEFADVLVAHEEIETKLLEQGFNVSLDE